MPAGNFPTAAGDQCIRVAIRLTRTKVEAAQTVSHTPVEEPAEHDVDVCEYSDADDGLQALAWARFRPLVMRLHFYAGILVAPFVLVAACTGLVYALIPQIDNAVNRHELIVPQVGEQRLPLAGILLGYRMWWRRRPARAYGFVLPAGQRRGVLDRLRPYEAVLVVGVLVASGWFAPLFGLTLALFVVVDVVLGCAKWRSGKSAP